MTRYQLANCYMGRIGLINSGGASGANDFADAVRTAVINKRAGGMGLISGRKAFQRPMAEGVKLLQLDPGRLSRSVDHGGVGRVGRWTRPSGHVDSQSRAHGASRAARGARAPSIRPRSARRPSRS